MTTSVVIGGVEYAREVDGRLIGYCNNCARSGIEIVVRGSTDGDFTRCADFAGCERARQEGRV